MDKPNPFEMLIKAYKGEEDMEKFLQDAVFNFLVQLTIKASLKLLRGNTVAEVIIQGFCFKHEIGSKHIIANDLEELNELTINTMRIASKNLFVEFEKNKKIDWETIIKNDPNQKQIYEETSQDHQRWEKHLIIVKQKRWTQFFEKQEKIFLQSKEGLIFKSEIRDSYIGSCFLDLLHSLAEEIFITIAEDITNSENATILQSNENTDENEDSSVIIMSKNPTDGFMPWTKKTTQA